MAKNDTKTCPFCAETIKWAAIACRYCGRDLPSQQIDNSGSGKPRSDLSDFIEYQLRENRKKARYTFVARAQERNTVPLFVRMLPIGDVFVYDNFIAFLSLDEGAPGTTMMTQAAIQEVGEILKAGAQIYEWVTSPVSILKDVGGYLSKDYKHEDVLAIALLNSNSFFIRIDEIEAVQIGSRGILGNYIRLSTCEKEYLICQETGEESYENFGLGSFKVWHSIVSKRWQTRFVSMLQSCVQKKRG